MTNTVEIRLLLLLSAFIYSDAQIPILTPPILRSCSELYEAGYTAANSWTDGTYMIDPDGPGTGVAAFAVECDLTTGPTGFTVFTHDKGTATSVPTGSVNPGSFTSTVTYTQGTLEQIAALVAASDSCSQEFTFECTGVRMWGEDGKALTWWESPDDFIRNNWGANYNTRGCKCSETTACAGGADARCNCDMADTVPRMDTGTVTDKLLLPVKTVKVGGVGITGSEMASFHLGDLRCTGSAFTYRSCKAIQSVTLNPLTLGNYFMLDPDGNGGESPFLAYCPSTALVAAGETWVAHNLCDMGTRNIGDGVTAPDCSIMGRADAYDGTEFTSCTGSGCASVDVIYGKVAGAFTDVQTAQIVALIDASTACQQDLQVTCQMSVFLNGVTPQRWWRGGHTTTNRYNFGGTTGSTGCTTTGGTCACDMNDAQVRTDFGTIMDKTTLPINQILNSNTIGVGKTTSINVGQLICSGNELLDECTDNKHTCDANAACTDSAEGYACVCNANYWGDGYVCNEIIFYLECESLEGFENDGPINFKVFRTGNDIMDESTVQVNFASGGAGQAVHPGDFVDMSVPVTFPATSTVSSNAQYQTVLFNLAVDFIQEGNETFTVSLSTPVNGVIMPGWFDTATGTIFDDDASFRFEMDKYEVSEEAGYVDINIIREGHLNEAGSVGVTTTADTALEGTDFAALNSATVNFNMWEMMKTMRISFLNDRIPEETEQFFVGLDQPVNDQVVQPDRTTITVTDVDTSLCPATNDFTAIESVPSVNVVLTRAGDLSQPGTVRVTAYVNDITGAQILNDEFTIPANMGSYPITIDLTDDRILEGTDSVTFYIINAGSDHLCADREVVIMISDDDSSYGLSETHYTAQEAPGSTVEIVVERNGYLGGSGSCNLVTSIVTNLAESARPGLDYIHKETTVMFTNNAPSVSVFIDILNDSFLESDEAFQVTLSNCVNGVLIEQAANAFVGIVDDDTVEEIPVLPVFTFATRSYEINEEEGLLLVTVNKQGSGDASVRVATYPTESSAMVTQDYTGVNQLLNFVGTASTQTVSIPIVNDNAPEESETIVLKLSNPINAVLGNIDDRKTVVTIMDRDSIVYFVRNEVSVPEGSAVAQVEVIRQGYLEQPLTVGVVLQYATTPAGADGDDFEQTPTTLSFGMGVASAIAEIPIKDDTKIEGIETFEVRLEVDPNRPGTLTVGEVGAVTVNILDDDAEDTGGGDFSMALIIGGSVVGALVAIGILGLALALCFRSVANTPAQVPPRYPAQPPPGLGYPSQPPPGLGYPSQPPPGYPGRPYDSYPGRPYEIRGSENPAYYGGNGRYPPPFGPR